KVSPWCLMFFLFFCCISADLFIREAYVDACQWQHIQHKYLNKTDSVYRAHSQLFLCPSLSLTLYLYLSHTHTHTHTHKHSLKYTHTHYLSSLSMTRSLSLGSL